MIEADIYRADKSLADGIAAALRGRIPPAKVIAEMETNGITPMVSISALEMSILLDRIRLLKNEVLILRDMLLDPAPGQPASDQDMPDGATILPFPGRTAPPDDGPEAA